MLENTIAKVKNWSQAKIVGGFEKKHKISVNTQRDNSIRNIKNGGFIPVYFNGKLLNNKEVLESTPQTIFYVPEEPKSYSKIHLNKRNVSTSDKLKYHIRKWLEA